MPKSINDKFGLNINKQNRFFKDPIDEKIVKNDWISFIF